MPDRTKSDRNSFSVGEITVNIEPSGPSPEVDAEIRRTILRQAAVRRALSGVEHRLIALDYVEIDAGDKPRRPSEGPTAYRATIYDYTNDRTLIATATLAAPSEIELTWSGLQPVPSTEEFDAAVAVVREDPDLGPALRDGQLGVYPPMPPIVGEDLEDGRRRRLLAVGLVSPRGAERHEIVGVSPVGGPVVRYDGGAPGTTLARPGFLCGLPQAGQPTANHVPGAVNVAVSVSGTEVWRFRAIRPAASSGTNGSGIELRGVYYRGKSLLYQAHVPFLNVRYDANACGPYRDWQNQEGMIDATGIDVAPGFRFCPTPARTILDSGSDSGNFLGTAIYIEDGEVVLVAEMEAGWYRYVSQWRFGMDGTIKPRFGFGAVSSSCVCNIHHHHVYWRLDFDVRTAGGNAVREYNDPPIFGGNWHDKQYEIRRPRDPSHLRRWQVVNLASGEAVDILPGPGDGEAASAPDAPFGRGDLWITRWHPGEIDDGVVAVGPPYEADIDRWLNGEPIHDADVVVWYGAHFSHDVQHEALGSHGHIMGPDLRVANW